MAENDGYGPFGRLTTRHWYALAAIGGGVFEIVSGVIGYDIGKRWSDASHPEETRWMGHVLWHEVSIGLALVGCAVYLYRTIRLTNRGN